MQASEPAELRLRVGRSSQAGPVRDLNADTVTLQPTLALSSTYQEQAHSCRISQKDRVPSDNGERERPYE